VPTDIYLTAQLRRSWAVSHRLPTVVPVSALRGRGRILSSYVRSLWVFQPSSGKIASVQTTCMSKAEALREQYENVFTREDLNKVPILPESHTRIFRVLYTFSTRGIQKLLESTRPDKASGPDQIPACVLNGSAFEFALILTSLFKQSFDKGALPSAWRDANITAIFKKRHSVDPKNYRPVSLTSLIAKTMEHLICKQICSHLSRNSVISQHQNSFQKGLSCETRGQVEVIFFGFVKALDTMPHERLLLKAKFYGISGNLITGFGFFPLVEDNEWW